MSIETRIALAIVAGVVIGALLIFVAHAAGVVWSRKEEQRARRAELRAIEPIMHTDID